MDQRCHHYDAKFWLQEKDHKSNCTFPILMTCCANGKIRLPPLLESLLYLLNLYTSSASNADSFHKKIRAYNNIFACTSFGANIDREFQGRGVFNFQIHGQVYHRISLLLPEEGHSPAFAQLYIYATHESQN